MTPNRKLSKNFSLHELLVSDAAARLGFEEQYEPAENVIANLEALCVNVLQPLRDALNAPLHVNSGYRCPRVNSAIGGASKSQHLTGHAADINDFTNGNEFLLKKIIGLKLPFDQVINEFGFRWIHISYDPVKNRREVLEAVKDKDGKTVYREVVFA